VLRVRRMASFMYVKR